MKHSGHVKDKDRWSWIQPDLNYCFLCSAENVPLEKHEVYNGAGNRQKSKDYGFVIALCPRCHRLIHSNQILDGRVKAMVQGMWEQQEGHSREQFMQIFHKNYRED